jgi:glucokinase
MSDRAGQPEYLVGVDFGGTKLYAGVFTPKLTCVGTARISTKANRGADAVIERIARCVREAVDECDLKMSEVRGVGIGAPGAVDAERGIVIFGPNLGWENVPLKKELEKDLGVPVFVENDCNMAMLGVYEVELKAKTRHALGIFVGTGIGAGLIINGELYSGFNHIAGEVGHIVLEAGRLPSSPKNIPKCGCGNPGCLEALASRTAIFNRIQAAIKDGEETVLTLLAKDCAELRSGHLRKAIRRGDKLAEKVVHEAAEYIGIAAASLMNVLNPEVVVLGGGVIEALEEEMMPTIAKTALEYAMPGTAKGVQIRACKLADEAGITGGAVLALRGTK